LRAREVGGRGGDDEPPLARNCERERWVVENDPTSDLRLRAREVGGRGGDDEPPLARNCERERWVVENDPTSDSIPATRRRATIVNKYIK
jgi:hypothetical protein